MKIKFIENRFVGYYKSWHVIGNSRQEVLAKLIKLAEKRKEK